MNLYDEFYPVVLALLTELGVAATLTRTVITGGSQYTGGGAKTSSMISTQASIAPETVVDDQGRQVTAMVATMLAEPRQGDQLTIGSMSYTVGRVTAIAPQGQAILYRAEMQG